MTAVLLLEYKLLRSKRWLKLQSFDDKLTTKLDILICIIASTQLVVKDDKLVFFVTKYFNDDLTLNRLMRLILDAYFLKCIISLSDWDMSTGTTVENLPIAYSLLVHFYIHCSNASN